MFSSVITSPDTDLLRPKASQGDNQARQRRALERLGVLLGEDFPETLP
jgi:hypothetical protein